MVLQSVEDFFTKERNTVEEYNQHNIDELKWDYPDVLYSFRGIYAIGIFIFYRDLFVDNIKTDIILKDKNDGKRQLLYSNTYLSGHYTEFTKVNELPEQKRFLSHYYDIGNVIPTWPGANVNRGTAHCYDIPNVYYKRHMKISELFFGNVYNAFIDKVLAENKYGTVADLLKMDETEYVTFLNYIIRIIQERTDKIQNFLKEERKLDSQDSIQMKL